MNDQELQQRITVWTWAARTLGVEHDEHRIAGLVDVTRIVPVSDLKAAIESVMRTEANGYMPSPGGVIAAYRALSEQRARTRQIEAPKQMSRDDHQRWMAANNPHDWDDAKWSAYVERMAIDAGFKRRVDENMARRHRWADEQLHSELGGRHVSTDYRIRLRQKLNVEAIDKFPRIDPLEDGWVPSKDFDPLSAIGKG